MIDLRNSYGSAKEEIEIRFLLMEREQGEWNEGRNRMKLQGFRIEDTKTDKAMIALKCVLTLLQIHPSILS